MEKKKKRIRPIDLFYSFRDGVTEREREREQNPVIKSTHICVQLFQKEKKKKIFFKKNTITADPRLSGRVALCPLCWCDRKQWQFARSDGSRSLDQSSTHLIHLGH